jgi:hypothetical protein
VPPPTPVWNGQSAAPAPQHQQRPQQPGHHLQPDFS